MAEPGTALDSRLATLRARGAGAADPLHWDLIEAMARRARSHDGRLRQLLDERIAALLTDLERRLLDMPSANAVEAPRAAGVGPLGELVAALEQPPTPLPAGTPTRAEVSAPPPELKSLRYWGPAWARLRVDRRLTQTRAQVPENAGPLNSHRVLHRTLAALREASPEYLDHFMRYVEALAWLDEATGARLQERKEPSRDALPRKTTTPRPRAGRPASSR